MPKETTPRPRVPISHHLLASWMRFVALLVPDAARSRWRAEWDGELWYGFAAKASGAGIRRALALSTGLLRDALELRHIHRSVRRLPIHRGDGMFRSILSDALYSIRLLRRTPGFAAIAAITLALGIGATTAIFSVVSALLLNPLPYPDADRLVILWQGRSGRGVDKDWLSPAQFLDIRDGSDVFEDLTLCGGSSATMTGRGLPEELSYFFVSSSFFEMFDATPALGRVFDERDDLGGEPIVAILSHALWQTAFGGDPDVLGQTITLNSTDHEIVGVLSPDFLLDYEVFPTVGGRGRLDVLLSPLYSEQEMLDQRGNENWNVFGRLRPGVTIAQAQASMDLVAEQSAELYEESGAGFFIRAVPLLEEVVGDTVHRGLLILLASVTLLLFIACGNVANLLLARSKARLNEMGVRVALGAGRGRLVRQLLTENMLLSLIGGILGILIALGAVAFLTSVGENSLPRLAEIGVDGNVLAFATLVTFATTLAFGLLPALRSSGIDVANVIASGGRGTVGSGVLWARFNLSSWLVVAEIGLSLVLLIGAGLLTRSMLELQKVDPGFNAEQTLTFRYSLRGIPHGESHEYALLVADIESRLAALPGVGSVASTTVLPFAPGVSWGWVAVEGYVPPAGEDETFIADSRIVTTQYFETMSVPTLRGRTFDEQDRGDGERVAIVDERFAQKAFADQDPIGRRIGAEQGQWATVVGVVPTVKDKALDAEPHYTVYYPHAQIPLWGGYFILKTTVEPSSLISAVRRSVAEVNDRVAVVDPQTMTQRVADSLAQRRFSMLVLRIFSLASLILAAVGVYGLVSYRVSQGTHELGMRMALGAPRGTILRLVLGHGMLLAGVGVAIGLAVALMIVRLMTAMLFAVSATDALTYAGVSAFLLGTVFFACFVPARRAATVDPLEALRAE